MTFDQWFEENVVRKNPNIGESVLQIIKKAQKEIWEAALKSEKDKGEVVVTKNRLGEIIMVSRQDEDGQILKVIAQPGFTEDQINEYEETRRLLRSFRKPQVEVNDKVARVKEVRNRTNTSLMSAKHALEKYNWDIENAITYLTKGSAYVK